MENTRFFPDGFALSFIATHPSLGSLEFAPYLSCIEFS